MYISLRQLLNLSFYWGFYSSLFKKKDSVGVCVCVCVCVRASAR